MIQRPYICAFILHRKDASSPHHLVCRVKWNGSRSIVSLNVGYVVDPEHWDARAQRCDARSYHGRRKIPAQRINSEIVRFEQAVEAVFAHYDVPPEVEALRHDLKVELGIEAPSVRELSFAQAYARYIEECSRENSWTAGTIKTIKSIGRRLEDSEIFSTLADFTRPNLEKLVDWLRTERGLSETTIHRQLGYLRWFCHWAEGEKLLTCNDYMFYRPKMKLVQRPVIFLTWEELMRVRDFRGSGFQERVRDVFLFCAFTSLRYSDAMALTWDDVHEDCIRVVTQKTSDGLIIELNKYSSEVLERCRQRRKDDHVLPHYENQVMNRELKKIIRQCGIDEPVKITQYRAGERIDTVRPKWELVGTHAARRTFICNALMMGINPTTVMQWTGHCDYDSMKPYIAIADKARAQAMSLFDKR